MGLLLLQFPMWGLLEIAAHEGSAGRLLRSPLCEC